MENQTKGSQAKQDSKPAVSPDLQFYLEYNIPWDKVKDGLLNTLRSYTLMSMVVDRSNPDDELEEFVPSYRERIEDIDFLFDILRNT